MLAEISHSETILSAAVPIGLQMLVGIMLDYEKS
jgi:hypothetical protein